MLGYEAMETAVPGLFADCTPLVVDESAVRALSTISDDIVAKLPWRPIYPSVVVDFPIWAGRPIMSRVAELREEFTELMDCIDETSSIESTAERITDLLSASRLGKEGDIEISQFDSDDLLDARPGHHVCCMKELNNSRTVGLTVGTWLKHEAVKTARMLSPELMFDFDEEYVSEHNVRFVERQGEFREALTPEVSFRQAIWGLCRLFGAIHSGILSMETVARSEAEKKKARRGKRAIPRPYRTLKLTKLGRSLISSGEITERSRHMPHAVRAHPVRLSHSRYKIPRVIWRRAHIRGVGCTAENKPIKVVK